MAPGCRVRTSIRVSETTAISQHRRRIWLLAIFAQKMADARRRMRLPLVALGKLTGISRGYLSLAEPGAAT